MADQGIISAIREGRSDDVLLLLDAGADPDTRQRPYAALHCAVMARKVELARILLDAGADVNVRSDRHQRTPLHYAVDHADARIDSGVGTTLVRLLLNRGAEVDAADFEGGTPLYVASWRGSVAAVRLLASHGAELDRGPTHGSTPLASAAAELDLHGVEALLSLGADPNRANLEGITAVHLVVRALRENRDSRPAAVGILDALIRHGADPNRPTLAVWGHDELPAGTTPAAILAGLRLPKAFRAEVAARLR
jgi:ankyrin repeat protein